MSLLILMNLSYLVFPHSILWVMVSDIDIMRDDERSMENAGNGGSLIDAREGVSYCT